MARPQSVTSGQTFNHWTIVEYVGSGKWLCKCICGAIRLRKANAITSGAVKSCGCMASQLKAKARKAKSNNYRLRREIYRNYKYAAIRREHEFHLKFDEFSTMLDQDCHYCGEKPSSLWKDSYLKETSTPFYYNGIDRVNSLLGYISSNCVPACKPCNRAKSNMSLDEWVAWAKRLCKFQQFAVL